VDLAELPALRLSADDAQPWLYGACVVSGGQQATTALGQFDLSILDRNRLAIRFGPRDPIARQVADCRTTGTKLPIAVLLGTAPALTLAAAARLYEPALDPLLLAGLLGAQALDIVSCRTVALQVPAEADIVIEGTIDPQAPPLTDVAPGACGGFRLPPSDAVEIQVTALTQRPQPLATASIPHAPPNEATAVARAIARLWLPVTKRLIPGLVDLDVPPTALAGQIAVLAIRKEFPGQASQAAAAWWDQHAGTTTKMIIVVDAEVDVRDAAGMWSEVAALADAGGDILFLDGPLNSRDQSAAAVGHRMAIDATSKLPGERGQSGLKRMLIGVVSH
jgi:4-hydroxy-3-polyprenylbenzoate decarboxylase